MLRLLTDEQVSPAVAKEARRRLRSIDIVAMHDWEGGHFLGASDEIVLQEAHKQKLTLVTFDLRTIPPLLRLWVEHGIGHSGVILTDNRTFAQNDIGGLVDALCSVWKARANMEWQNEILYLSRRPGPAFHK